MPTKELVDVPIDSASLDVVDGSNTNANENGGASKDDVPQDAGNMATVSFAPKMAAAPNENGGAAKDDVPQDVCELLNSGKNIAKFSEQYGKPDERKDKHSNPSNPSRDTQYTKRLSASVEHVDLEYSLGSLESSTNKRRLSPSLLPSAPSSTGSAKKKKLSPAPPPSKSLTDAIKNPKFWQDSASVSENNIASASFDVADETGGSSPVFSGQDDNNTEVGDGSRNNDNAKGPKRRLTDEEKRSIKEAEDVMKVAKLAAQETPPDNSLYLGDDSNPRGRGKTAGKSSGKDALDDFDKHIKDNTADGGNLSSEASSLVESYTADDNNEDSKPLPPAPPSTPAKDGLMPLPYQPSSLSRGRLSTSKLSTTFVEDKGNAPTLPKWEDTIPPPPEYSQTDEDATPPAGSNTASSPTRLKKESYKVPKTPDMSGAATEPRRGGGGDNAGSSPTKSDIDNFDKWEVSDRYQLKRILGRGSYGEVAQALDSKAKELTEEEEEELGRCEKKNSKYVAVKKISKAFEREIDAIRLFREMHILRRIQGHQCVIQLLDAVQPRSSDLAHFNDLYLVFEYVDTDLYKLIMSPQYLTTEHIQTFLYQMLAGLKYVHSFSVIHRDLKPANILINEDCTLKICDFGLARIVHKNEISPTITKTSDTDADGNARQPTVQDITDAASHLTGVERPNLSRQLTKHVVTRWYRAPELILIQPYSSSVDMWSLGCIFGELLSMQEGSVPKYQDREPLFPGGSCYPLSGDRVTSDTDEQMDQLSVIFSVIGMPSEEDLKSVRKVTKYIKSLPKKPGRSLESLYPAADPEAIDLLKHMLMFNPAKRCTCEEALDHEFLKPVRQKETLEENAGKPLESPAFLEKMKVNVTMLKEETYKEVLWFSDKSS